MGVTRKGMGRLHQIEGIMCGLWARLIVKFDNFEATVFKSVMLDQGEVILSRDTGRVQKGPQTAHLFPVQILNWLSNWPGLQIQ